MKSSEAKKNLGLYAPPDGSSDKHLASLRKKMEDWKVRAKNGKLPTRPVWTSYSLQLWAGIKYGLGNCLAPMEKLEAGLVSADFRLTSCLGVVRTIKK